MGQFSPLSGLAAAVEQKRKQFEAGEAARGNAPAEKPKEDQGRTKPTPRGATPTPVKQMPKDEVDALRVAEMKQREAREKARQGSKR